VSKTRLPADSANNGCRIGPIIGALMASGYYGLCRASNYWEANPGQDSKGHNEKS